MGHQAALDGVRGLAIVGVLLAHAQSHGALPWWLPGGHLGVTVFFVLSGFLITTLLLEEYDRHASINLRHFYLRRAARLVPALLVLLPFHALVWSFDVSVDTVLLALVPMLLYVTNLMRAHAVMHMAGTTFGWSLAIEEQFYLGWPPLLKRVLERGRSWLLPVGACLTVIAVAATLRLTLADNADWKGWLYYSTVTRIDALAIGCLAALARWRFQLPWVRVAGWAGLAWLGYAYATYHAALPSMFTVGLFSIALATAALVLAVTAAPAGWLARAVSQPALVRLGALSYGLYLWNLLPFQGWVIFTGARPGLTGTVVCLLLGYGAAALSYRLVEQPVMAWAKAAMRGQRRQLWSLPAPRRDPEHAALVHAAQLRAGQAAATRLPTLGATIR
ncbi:MAG: acyltransferase family protein [Micromonosporaceae bacterium]